MRGRSEVPVLQLQILLLLVRQRHFTQDAKKSQMPLALPCRPKTEHTRVLLHAHVRVDMSMFYSQTIYSRNTIGTSTPLPT